MQIKPLLVIALLAIAPALKAADIDMKLTTNTGATKISVLDSDNVEVSSITSDGNAYFKSVEITTGSVATQMTIGDVLMSGSAGLGTDSYIAIPLTASAAIATKQAVVLTPAGQVATNTTNSSNTIVGITVTATSGAGQKIYVAVAGVVTGVTCQVAMGAGSFVCNGGTTAGRVGACSSLTNNMLVLGRLLTACTAGGAGTMYLNPR